MVHAWEGREVWWSKQQKGSVKIKVVGIGSEGASMVESVARGLADSAMAVDWAAWATKIASATRRILSPRFALSNAKICTCCDVIDTFLSDLLPSREGMRSDRNLSMTSSITPSTTTDSLTATSAINFKCFDKINQDFFATAMNKLVISAAKKSRLVFSRPQKR